MTLPDLKNLITVEKLIEKYPVILSVGSVRWWLHQRNKNGLKDSGAIIKIEKKLFIDEVKFIDWLQKNKMKVE